MSNVILTGGNSLLTGFSERLVNELQARTPPALRFKLINLQSPQMTTERLFRYILFFYVITSTVLRMLIEHIDSICSSRSEVFFVSMWSIRILGILGNVAKITN